MAIPFFDFIESEFSDESLLNGVTIYRAGGVQKVEKYGNLLQCQVRAGIGERFALHIKFHEDGRAAQWMDCSCKENRRRGVKCAHLAALLIYLDLEEGKFLQKFQLAGGGAEQLLMMSKGGGEEEASNTDVSGESGGLETSDEGSSILLASGFRVDQGRVEKISSSRDPGTLNLTVKQPGGKVLKYRLGVDDSILLLASPQLRTLLSDRLRQEVVRNVRASRAFSVSRTRQGRYQICKVILFEEGATESSIKWCDVPEICKGSRGVYYRKFGFVPWKEAFDEAQARRWSAYPDQADLESHEVAGLVDTDFEHLKRTAEVRLSEGLQGFKIVSQTRLKSVEVEESGEGSFLIAADLGGDRSAQAPQLSLFDVVSARIAGQRFVEVDGGWVKIGEEFDWVKERVEKSGKIRLSKLELIRFRETVGRDSELRGLGPVAKRLCEGLLSFSDVRAPALSGSHLQLRPYQEQGYQWLWWLYSNGLGGLLADEMGLGKTHQAMALLYGIRKAEGHEAAPSLVVCPTSVIDHWQDKLLEFLPECMTVSYYGGSRSLRGADRPGSVVVTSYGVLLRDDLQLSQINWSVVVLDEAHLVKNQTTRTYHAACRLKSKMRLCLTGTPLENELSELKTLFDFIVPSYLGGDIAFRKKFMSAESQNNPLVSLELKQLIHPFKLRRAKSEVLQHLPAKVEDIRHCQLSAGQQHLYDQALQMKAQGIVESLSQNDSQIPYVHVFAILTLLKQICNDPGLVHPDYDGIPSGKLELLDELMRESIECRQKVVVFSQYAKMIERISSRLQARGIGHVSLTGQSRNRGAIIKKFQEDPETHVFLGSLLAGGTGIDLTAASVVIHFDRWWNAAKENQATDRIHRIGQQKNVQVFKLVTRGTLEEHIDKIIERKRRTFEKYVEQDLEVEGGLSRDDVLKLLSPRQQTFRDGEVQESPAEGP